MPSVSINGTGGITYVYVCIKNAYPAILTIENAFGCVFLFYNLDFWEQICYLIIEKCFNLQKSIVRKCGYGN